MRKVYLITGVTSDLSDAFLRQLAVQAAGSEDDYIVYGTYHKSIDIINRIKSSFPSLEIKTIQCDMGKDEDVQKLISIIKDDEVPNYFLHLAAARLQYMRLVQFDWERTKKELDIQIGGFAQICRWLVPKMSKRNFGRIVVMGSSCTFGMPPKYMSDYVLIKHGLLGLVKAIASEYSGKHITCNMISPDMMETKFLADIDKRVAEINALNSAMKRNVTVDEVAAGIMYLFSDYTGYINGINLNISGGNYM